MKNDGLYAWIWANFVTPPNGGRATDPAMTERRLIGMSRLTMRRLAKLARQNNRQANQPKVTAMQVAAVLLEMALAEIKE